MARYINHYPHQLTINGETFKRVENGTSLHDSLSSFEYQKNQIKRTHYIRSFWTGGEKLSNGTIRKSYFLMVRKKI